MSKGFTSLKLLLPTQRKKERLSYHFRDNLINSSLWRDAFLREIREGKTSSEEVIFKVMGIKKRIDPIAFYNYEVVIEYLLGNHHKVEDVEEVILESALDITLVFNSEKRMDTFLYFLFSHVIKKRVRNIIPMIQNKKSFCIDFYYFLGIIEDYFVDECSANREEARAFISKKLGTYHSRFFLIVGIFKLNYMLISMKVPEIVYVNSAKREVLKSWIPAIYVDENQEEIYVRQIQFSIAALEKRAKKNENSYSESLFDKSFFDEVKEEIIENELIQLAWGKEANEILSSEMKSEDSEMKWWFRYGDD